MGSEKIAGFRSGEFKYIVGTRRRSFTLSFVFDVIDLCTRHPLHRGDFIVTEGGMRNDGGRARERKSKEKPRLEQFVRNET